MLHSAGASRLTLQDALRMRVYKVPSGSMEPTLAVGQRILVNRIGMSFGEPKVGEIVVFNPPEGAEHGICGPNPHEVTPGGAACAQSVPQRSSVTFVKRIVAGPGDTIYIKEGHVYLNGKREKDSYIRQCGESSECNFPTPIKIPAGHWFMLGDNRGNSEDSRFWGPIPTSWIIGEASRESASDEREFHRIAKACDLYRSGSDARIGIVGRGAEPGTCERMAQQFSSETSYWVAGTPPSPNESLRLICALQRRNHEEAVVVADSGIASYGTKICGVLAKRRWMLDRELIPVLEEKLARELGAEQTREERTRNLEDFINKLAELTRNK